MYFLVIHNNYKVFLGPFFKFMGVKGKADILWGSIHLMTSWKPGEKENNLMLLDGGDTKECFFAGCADFECHSKILLLLRPQKLQKQKIVMATRSKKL